MNPPSARLEAGRRVEKHSNGMPRICWDTIFICGNSQWYGKPLKQRAFLPRPGGHSSRYWCQQRQVPRLGAEFFGDGERIRYSPDGALGFWKALGEVWLTTREQRCWVHKTANILNMMPKSLHAKAKRALQEIWMAETKKDAVTALEAFVETYQVKYERAADCLTKDRDALLAFYDFPAEHWKHLRTTNPIESTFATVRHRTIRSKGCLSNKTALAMVFKLVEGAQKSWRRIDGHNQLPKLIQGVKFADGIEVIRNSAVSHAQAAA